MHRDNTTQDQDAISRRRRRQAGFTLVELLVVIAIRGMLAAVAGTQVIGYLCRAKVDTARLQIDQIEASLDLFRLDVGRYPSSDEGLRVLVEPPANAGRWAGPYLKKRKTLVDPWNRPFDYVFPGRHGTLDIFSLGGDNADGGEGCEGQDVANWGQ